MAERKFSELPSAASLTGNELAALSQMQSGSLASVKSTLQAIANWFAVYAQYTTALQTTDKSIAGAINELKQLISLIPQFSIEVVQVLPTEDISDTTIYLVPAEDPEVGNYYEEYIHVNNTWELVGTTAVDLSAYYTKLEVDGLLEDKLEADDFEASQTASTNQITLETKQAGLAKSCVVEMNPIQDLHGYDNPWVGGAGKNKLPFDLATIKANNTDGTWNGNVYTYNGVAWTVNEDGSVIANGTPTGDTILRYLGSGPTSYAYELPSADYKITTGFTRTGSRTTFEIGYRPTGESIQHIFNNDGYGLINANVNLIQLVVREGYTADNLEFEPMIVASAESDYTFIPYSNICPISGRTEVSAKRTGKNEIDEDFLLLANGWTKSGGEYSGLNSALHSAFSGGYSGNIKFHENTQYTVSFDFKSNDDRITVFGFKYSDGTTSTSYLTNTTYERKNFTSTINKTVVGILFSYGGNTTVHFKEFQLEQGTTATAYEPYTAETRTKEFGQTVYGGSLDLNSGVLTITYGKVDLGDLTYTSESAIKDGQFFKNISSLDALFNSIPYCENYKGVKDRGASNMNDGEIAITNSLAVPILRIYDSTKAGYTAEQFATAMSGVKFVFVLKTPIEAQLSPEAMTLLKGMNVISTDGDKVQVEFSDIPVGDYSVLLDYIKSLEARIAAVEP